MAARQRQPIEFVQVQIVPLQALGVPEPVTVEPRPEPPPRPSPSPTAAPETARTAPEPSEEQRSQEAREQAKPAESAGPPPGALQQRQGSPTGSPLATSPFGTAVAGFDNPDFVYGYYVEQMLAMIGKNWIRPSAAGNLEMTIHFRIQNDGTLIDIEIVEPSGHTSFDLAGERAVRLASPLPPLPRSFPHDSLGVNLIIR